MFAECSMDRIDQWVSAASKVFLSPRAHTFRNGMDSGVDHGLLGLRKDENFSRETAAQTFRQSFTPNRLGRPQVMPSEFGKKFSWKKPYARCYRNVWLRRYVFLFSS